MTHAKDSDFKEELDVKTLLAHRHSHPGGPELRRGLPKEEDGGGPGGPTGFPPQMDDEVSHWLFIDLDQERPTS